MLIWDLVLYWLVDLDHLHAVARCFGAQQANHEDCQAKSLVGFCVQYCKFVHHINSFCISFFFFSSFAFFFLF